MRCFSYALVVIIFFIIGLNCDRDSTGPAQQTGILKVYLTDAFHQYDYVNITFSEITAHLDSSWLTVQGNPVTVNLLEWNNGKSIVIGSAGLPAGKYTQIRLKIAKAEIGMNGQVHPLIVPGGAQTGLKLGPQFTIDPGSTYELVLDFDVRKSIVTTGAPGNPKAYKLKPHLRIIPRAITGSISGTVTNFTHVPVACVLQNADTLTSTPVDATNGFFMLSFLPGGIYTVVIEDTTGASFIKKDVNVSAGTNNDIGVITLQ